MKIAIIGSGYIGTELSMMLKKDHYITIATNTVHKMILLEKISQKTIILDLKDDDQIFDLLANNDAIVITISADKQEDFDITYLKIAQAIKKQALLSDIKRTIIYTSSIVVYGDQQGKWVDETASINPISNEAQILSDTENIYLSLKEDDWKICILRLAEIYGPGHDLTMMIKELEKNIIPGKGDNFTNMIHLEDVLYSIDYALNHHLEGIYNIVDDDHPTRKELYHQISQKMHLTDVKWNPNYKIFRNTNKKVSNHKIKSAGYHFFVPSRKI